MTAQQEKKQESAIKPKLKSGRRSNGTVTIPEETQAKMRNRLKLIRESRGMYRGDLESITPSTLTKLEKYDISTLRMGDLYGLALEYGVSMEELLEYIIGKVDTETSDESRRIQRMIVFLRSLDETSQELACDLVQRLVVHAVDKRDLERVKRLPGVRRNGRQATQDALAAESD